MAELRHDPVTGRTVIFAADRSLRPQEFSGDGEPSISNDPISNDPFLEGHESETPPEVFAVRPHGTAANCPGWTVRVVPNRYPALQPFPQSGSSLEQPASGSTKPARWPSEEQAAFELAFGQHEVVIECPHRETRFVRLGPDHVAVILDVWRQRLAAMSEEPRLAAAVLFKNEGAAAGASLSHCHSQIMATSFVPKALEEKMLAARRTFEAFGGDPFEQIVHNAEGAGTRLVAQSENFITLCPAASRFAWETWILPRSPQSHFEAIDSELLPELAAALCELLSRLDRCLDAAALNFVLHSAAFRADVPHFRWHLEIFPRTSGIAGFELGSGVFLNSMLPEDAASRLRNA